MMTIKLLHCIRVCLDSTLGGGQSLLKLFSMFEFIGTCSFKSIQGRLIISNDFGFHLDRWFYFCDGLFEVGYLVSEGVLLFDILPRIFKFQTFNRLNLFLDFLLRIINSDLKLFP